jgi:hypothetical protein
LAEAGGFEAPLGGIKSRLVWWDAGVCRTMLIRLGMFVIDVRLPRVFQRFALPSGQDWHAEERPPCRNQTESSFRPSSALSARWFCLPILFH